MGAETNRAEYSQPIKSDNFCARIRSRQTYMESVRAPAEALWAEIFNLLIPSSTPMNSGGQEGIETGKDIYTTDPVRYLRICVDGTMGGMVSPNFRWFTYAMSDTELSKDDEVRKWLQVCDGHMYNAFAKSNLYGVARPHFMYALGSGNSVLLKHEDLREGRLVFTCPHPRENFWLEDAYGRALPYHRKYEKTVSDILQMFPETQNPDFRKRYMSTVFQSAVESGMYYQYIKLLHTIDDAENPIFDDQDQVKVDRPFVQTYMEYEASDAKEQKPIKVEGFFTNPVNPWRLEKNDDEVYGRGIGHLAIGDIREAGEYKAACLMGVHREMDPPMVYGGNLRARLQKSPGGETSLDRSDWESARGPMVRELYNKPANFPAILEFRREVNVSLREWFSVDYFLQYSNLTLAGTTPPTATQLLGMADEKAILLIGRLGRFDSDCFDNLMQSSFYTEYAAGRLPPAPQQVLDAGGPLPSINYLGPLSQAQRHMHSVRNVMQAIAQAGPLFELMPKAVHKLRIPETVEWVFENHRIPQELIVPKAEFEETLAIMAQQEQQMMQAKMAAEMAKVVPAMGKKVDPSSVLAQTQGAAN